MKKFKRTQAALLAAAILLQAAPAGLLPVQGYAEETAVQQAEDHSESEAASEEAASESTPESSEASSDAASSAQSENASSEAAESTPESAESESASSGPAESTPESAESESASSEETGEGEEASSEAVSEGSEEEAPDETADPAAPALTASQHGSITIDGDDRDWASIDGVQMNANISGNTVTGWKAARDASGNVYLCITGTGNQWGIPNLQWSGFNLVQNGAAQYWNFSWLWQQDGVTHALGGDGCSSSNGGPFVLEMCLPTSLITDPDFVLEFGGVSLPAASLPTLDGTDVPSPVEPVYNGIVIDGDFADWDAVSKTDGPGCTNEGHPDCMDSCAMVFDGDYVYIYLRERPGMNAGSAGSHGNGNYAITTDLGRTLLIDLEADGTVSNIEGAQCVHNGTQWELAIPRSALPAYTKSLSFGFYLAEPVISGVENLDGSTSGGSFAGIVYDGQYDDWKDYPHDLIQYATPGSQGQTVDGEFAIYAEGSKLYGHTVTEYTPHLVGGYDLAYAVSIAFNGDRNYKDTPDKGNFYPYLVEVDEAGNINYNPNISNLSNGNHEFYIMDTRSWHSSKNIHDLQGNDRIFGRWMITIEDGREQCEYEIDLEQVAAYIGCDAGDFKLIEAQFGRIGQQWTSTAGASSGAWLGIALSAGAAGITLFWQRRRKQKA